MRAMRIRRAATLVIAVTLLGGCEAIFTYAPLEALRRPPSSLSPEALLTFAEDALASGDTVAMKAAYDEIKNDTSADAQYIAAELGIELSGIPGLLMDVARDPTTITASLDGIATFIADHSLEPTYLVDAAARLSAVDATMDLTPTDYALGALGMLLGSAHAAPGGSWDITDPAVDTGPALAFFANAVADVGSLPPDDPMRIFIEDFNSYLGGL